MIIFMSQLLKRRFNQTQTLYQNVCECVSHSYSLMKKMPRKFFNQHRRQNRLGVDSATSCYEM